jgi:hypothetical protein
VLLLCIVRSAAADPVAPRSPSRSSDDDEPLDPRVAESSTPADAGDRVPLWVSVGGSYGESPNGREIAGLLAFGTALDWLARPRELGPQRLARAEPTETERETTGEAPAAEPAPPAPKLTGPLARGSVRAALAAARFAQRNADLDDLSTRARAAGLLPELRFRLAHVLDEDQSLSPTEYDPDRVTASGGTSLWLEGRATFRLDRLVFADDEVAIEKLRAERERAARALTEDVLRALERWQRADALASDEAAPEIDRIKAELEAAAAEATLDVLTDGWFTSPGALALRR